MFKYIRLTALLCYLVSGNVQGQDSQANLAPALKAAYIQAPTMDLAKTIKMALYLGDKHSPNKVLLPFKTLSKTMNGAAVNFIFEEYTRQVNYQLSFLKYDYALVDKAKLADHLKTRLMIHPRAKDFALLINMMVAQLEANFSALSGEYITLTQAIDAIKVKMTENINFPQFTGEFFWSFLQTAFNPYENLKIILDKHVKPLEDFQNEWQNSSTLRNFYWDIMPLYKESQGKYLVTDFLLTYLQEEIKNAKDEAEKGLYIIVTQEVARAAKQAYYIPAFYLEKMQSAVHQYMKKERFMQQMQQINNTAVLKTWFNKIEHGFSLALLPLNLIQDDFETQLQASNALTPIRLIGKSKTFEYNNEIQAHTYDITLLTKEISLNNKPYIVELHNPLSIESAPTNRRSLLIYPKHNTDKSIFLQVNLLFYAHHHKIESYRMEIGITTMDLVKNLQSLDKDLYDFSELVKVYLVP